MPPLGILDAANQATSGSASMRSYYRKIIMVIIIKKEKKKKRKQNKDSQKKQSDINYRVTEGKWLYSSTGIGMNKCIRTNQL
jgi:hypothetical protein